MTMPTRTTHREPPFAAKVAGYLLAPVIVLPFVLIDGWLIWLAARWWGPDLDLPNLPFGHAIALSFVVSLIIHNDSLSHDEDGVAILKRMAVFYAFTPVALGVLGLFVR